MQATRESARRPQSNLIGAARILTTGVLLSLVVFATAGCVRAELGFKVNEDGSGAFTYTFAYLGGTPDPNDYHSSYNGLYAVPEDAEVEEFKEDDYEGFKATTQVADVTELTLWEDEFLDEFDDFSISRDDDEWRFSMRTPSLSDEPVPMDELSAEEKRLLRESYLRIRVELPGSVVEHNADRVEDDALVWELDWFATEERELSARSKVIEGWVFAPAVAAGVFVIVLALAFFVAYRMRRSNEAK